jgi:glucoamylase
MELFIRSVNSESGATLHNPDASLNEWMDAQYRLSAAAMMQSVSAVHLTKERSGFGQAIRPAKGSVLASPTIASYDPDPDYFFHWLRDSAAVIDAMAILIEDGICCAGALEHIGDFVRFSLALGDLDGRAMLENGAVRPAPDPAFQQYLRPADELSAAFGENIFGEARFNPDGTLDITKWGRPQHDGPALRALALLRFWRMGAFEDNEMRGEARRLIDADLAFTHRRCSAFSFDIWEEELGRHYYTQLVQSAALADGAQWIDALGDYSRARIYRTTSREILHALDGHWVADKGFYLSRVDVAAGDPLKSLDIATILGVIHARRDEGAHSVADPKSEATLARLEELFAREYAINFSLPENRGAAMGRYAGDRYYSGGAYYFATLAAAEFLFRLAEHRASRASPDAGLADQAEAYDTLVARGEGFMATVRAYTPANGDLSEQFDRTNGQQTSSKNLAWSHAALITAVAARRSAHRAADRAGFASRRDPRT